MAAAEPKPSLVERLFAEHRAALHTFFLRRIRTKADAADLAQEVYLRMLRISDQEAIRNPVHYLYTVANNLVKEHAVLDRRQASGIDIDEAPVHEQLETLPEFDGDLDASQRVAQVLAGSRRGVPGHIDGCARSAGGARGSRVRPRRDSRPRTG